MNNDIIILIPAFNPDETLICLIQELKAYGNKIIVVNDGSKEQKIFDKIKYDCEIIYNHNNLGKGASLRRGFKHILEKYTDIRGVITADADGQHLASDIMKVKNELTNDTSSIILGTRNFNIKKVPIRNKIGNKIMNYIFKIKTGITIKDTQTGLRGIPYKYLTELINIYGERFEYEINVLKYVANNIPIKEVDIETIYIDTKKTNFKMIKDSFDVIKNFMRN